MRKKLLVCFLAGLLVISSIMGCATDTGKNDNAKTEVQVSTSITKEPVGYAETGKLPITATPVTITLLSPEDDVQATETWTFNRIEELTGIKIKAEQVYMADYDQRLELMLASKTLPDIFNVSQQQANDYGPLGAFAAINKHLDILPTFSKIWDSEDYIRKNVISSDSNIYYFPIYKSERQVNHGMMYRKDIFDKNSIPSSPDGPDEWFNALKKLKEIYPDSIPLVSKTRTDFFRDMYCGWGNSRIDKNTYYGYDHDDGLFKFAPATEEWKEMLRYFNKLMENGLLDPEFLTSSSDDWTAKMTQEAQSFATFDWVDRMVMFKDAVKEKLPDYNLRYSYPMGPTGKHYSLSYVSPSGYTVAADSKNLEIALQLMDWLYTDEGSRITTMGEENETYTKDANGKVTYHELEAAKIAPAMSSLRDMYGLFRFREVMHPECIYFDYHEGLTEGLKMLVDNNRILPLDPIPTYTTEETEKQSELYAALKKSVEEYSSAVIFGKNNLNEDWDAWLKKAEQLGYKQIEEIQNNAYARYKAK